ncbi:MAG: SDR family oxidoreductase [Acidimicrobiales bacterium]
MRSSRPPDYGGRYRGKLAVVSGASSGLGRRMALDLAGAGATVVAVARRSELLEKLESELHVLSPHSSCHRCDVTDVAAWTRLLGEVERDRERIDLLVNNAAMDPGIRLADITVEDFERAFAVNFFAVVAGTLAVLPKMFEHGQGTVVNVSSDGGRLPSPGPGAYPASKAAIGAFTESVSFRAARHGVHMHVVYPAWMPTEMGLSALRRGLRTPPRVMRRSEEEVSSLVLARLGGPALDISASRLPAVAALFRAVAPLTYRRLRRSW